MQTCLNHTFRISSGNKFTFHQFHTPPQAEREIFVITVGGRGGQEGMNHSSHINQSRRSGSGGWSPVGNNRDRGWLTATERSSRFHVLCRSRIVTFPHFCHTAHSTLHRHTSRRVVMVYFLHFFSFLCPLGERTIPCSIFRSLSFRSPTSFNI